MGTKSEREKTVLFVGVCGCVLVLLKVASIRSEF